MSQLSEEVVIFDTEYWTDDGVLERNWCGLYDPPRSLIQIGAFKVRLDKDLTVIDEHLSYVIPRNRDGSVIPLNAFFTDLTKISQKDVDEKGVDLLQAITGFKDFTGDAPLYSYGYDVEATFLQSCFVAGVPCPFTVDQCRNVAKVFHHSGMSIDELKANTSGSLAAFYGIQLDDHHVHDARCDAMSILVSLRHLITKGKLDASYLGASFNVLDARPEAVAKAG